MQSDLKARAQAFAERAHAGQLRKYTGEPYIVHPVAVVELVRSVPHTEEMLAAAWLHDVVEDTGTSLELIVREFGDRVAHLVFQLTDISRPEDGNRKTRKALDRVHLAMASAAAKTIKLADLIDNSKSIVEHDPDFAKVYMQEKAELLGVLLGGDQMLWRKASDIVTQYLKKVAA